MKKQKQKEEEGVFFKVPLDKQYHTYGRIIAGKAYAFYDCKTDQELSLDEIKDQPVLFIIHVLRYAITGGRWPIIGQLPLEEKFQILPLFCLQHGEKPEMLYITPPWVPIVDASFIPRRIPATYKQCLNLEAFVFWYPPDVEERLRNHYQGKPNALVEQWKVVPTATPELSGEPDEALPVFYYPYKIDDAPRKRQRVKEGAFFKVPLDEQYHTYGRIIVDQLFAFYDSRTEHELTVEEIKDKPVLFILDVHKTPVKQGRWLIVGQLPLEEKFQTAPQFFMRNISNPSELFIYDWPQIIPATYEQCLGLEELGAWPTENVEDRLRDHYAGRPCIWLDELKPVPLP